MRRLTWEVATGRPTPTARLNEAALLYRSDRYPRGFNLVLSFYGSAEPLRQSFDLSAQWWDSAPEGERTSALDDYLAQIESLLAVPVERRNALDPAYISVFLINMMWLVWAGRVPQDEFNGTLFVWQTEKAKDSM